jgi:hypothetical protein
MRIRILALAVVLLQIIDLLEKIVFGSLEAHGRLVGDAEQFEGILENAAFYIFVLYACNFDLAIYPFEGGGAVVVRQGRQGDPDGDQLGFVVFVLVETGFQPTIGAILQKGAHQLVPVPVEEQYSHEQYGSKVFHVHKLITFLVTPAIFLKNKGLPARGSFTAPG